VKCIRKHHTKECQKREQSHPKCVNCGEAHRANYRGCIAARSNSEEAQNIQEESTISQMLLKIMAKLEQQESLNQTILENDSKRRAIPDRQN
jgi:hypothetical protein